MSQSSHRHRNSPGSDSPNYRKIFNRYKEIVHDEVEHRAPLEIIADIEQLEDEIAKGLAELKAMLS